MNGLIESLTGMDKFSDQVIATDFLVSAKSAVRNYSIALTETTSPKIKTILRNHLNDAITTHETILNFMIIKGYYHTYDLKEQFKVDMKTTDTALNLTGNNK